MRKLIIALLGCTVVLMAGYAGYRGYKVWKRDRSMTMARQFIAKSDHRNAVLSLQQVLAANPRNIDATRMMAELMEANHSQRALIWRSRLVELNPGSLDDRLALAQAAVAQRDYA